MKPFWPLRSFCLAILLLLTTSLTSADEFSGHVSGYLGLKTLNSSDWPDLDKHFAMGVFFDIKRDSWPISIALDLLDTGGKHDHDGMEDLGHTTELHLGIRKIFLNQHKRIQPYLGAGVSFIYAELELEVNNITEKQDDGDTGAWLGAGMYYEINPGFTLGLDVRYSYGEVVLFDKERNAGGIFAGITGGYQF